MLVLSRWTSKIGLGNLWEAIEAEKRTLYWEGVEPLYAMQQEGKRYISIMFNVKNLDAFQKVFHNASKILESILETRTIPVMRPIYFPLPKGHKKDLNRYMAFLRVAPEKYEAVYSAIQGLCCPKDLHITYISFSFGDDDIIVSMLAKDRETALNFVNDEIGKVDGVNAFDVARVVRYVTLVPKERIREHTAQFLHTAPAGKKGQRKNPRAYENYARERSPMTVVVRLFAKKSLPRLWEDIETSLPKLKSKDLVPLYASQQEAKDYITIITEATNFEALNDVVINNISTLADVRKTRTIPLLEPTYFLLPKGHPRDLERYLISLRAEPKSYQAIRSKIVCYDYPDNVFLSYLAYSLGEDDILLSVLTDSKKSVMAFAKEAFDRMDGVRSYEISNQLKTKRLASETAWKQHHEKFLSSYDRQHRGDYDTDYDWSNNFYEYAAMSGAFVHELDMDG
ncbi:MAG: hypothetical protein HZB92_07220 [Euryarchaeota archaeon]|nr:hypothetical protein [Euryarchaeota archaeon]